MKCNLSLFMLCLAFVCNGAVPDPKTYNARSCKFIENKGQFKDDTGKPVPFVLFKSTAPSLDYFITSSGITYVFSKHAEEDDDESEHHEQNQLKNDKNPETQKGLYTEQLFLELQNANILPTNIIKEGRSAHHYNYFSAHCPDGIYDVFEYEKITVKNVYPNIDWVLYGSSKTGLKYDFILHPGADASLIKLIYKSAKKPVLNDNGDITIRTSLGIFSEHAPLSFLQKDNTKINSGFKLISSDKADKHYETIFEFEGDFMNHATETIIIDPQLVWATFYGGNHYDGPMAIETDAAGNVFVCGYTYSINYPVNNTGSGSYYQASNTGIANFITKFANNGALSWSTYYGDGNPERAPKGLAVDKFGNVWVAGETYSMNFPLQNNGGYFQAAPSGSVAGEMFLLKFTNTGVRLWGTYFGGSSTDYVNSIDTDSLGNMYLGGSTFSNNFPLLNAAGYYQTTYFATNAGIAVLAKFDASCNLVWSTYFGNYYSNVLAVNCDLNNNLFVTGGHYGAGVPTVNPGGGAYFQATPSNTSSGFSYYCFVSKFDLNTNLIWSTNYGGNSGELGYSIVSDPVGNIFVAGRSASTNFPVLFAPGSYSQTNSSVNWRPFILKFNNSGVRQWATFCGGSVTPYFDSYDNLAIDPCSHDVNLTFSTSGRSLTLQPACDGGYLQTTINPTTGTNPPTDLAILRFTNNGFLNWSTYIGGNDDDFRSSIATDQAGNLYMTGEWTNSITSTYPLTNPGGSAYFDNTHNGIEDGYLVKFSPVVSTPTISYPAPICNVATTIAPNISPGASGTFSGTPGLSIDPFSGIINCNTTPLGTYTVTFSGSPCGCFTPAPQYQVVTIAISPAIWISSPTTTLCSGQSLNLLASTTSSSALNFTWSPVASNNNSISVTPLASTVYSLFAYDVNSGCTSNASLAITVYQSPTVNITGPPGICESSPATLVASGNGSITWSNGQNGSTSTVSPTLNTLYSVTCTAANSCTALATFPLVVFAAPPLTVSGPTTVCKGVVVNLIASGANSYLWSNGSNSNNYVITLTTNTQVSVSGTGANGCQKTQSISLVVDKCTGISESTLSEDLILIYPNPSSGEITIKASKALRLRLEDERGRLIQIIEIDTELKTVNFKLAEGIYFLRGNSAEYIINEKIIISK